MRGGEVQDSHWCCGMHRLRRQHVLCDGGRYSGEYLSSLSSELGTRAHITDSYRLMSLQPRIHGAQRRDVHRVRGGEVQDSHWCCGMHRLRRQHVLACDGRYSCEYLSELPRQLTVYDGQRRGD